MSRSLIVVASMLSQVSSRQNLIANPGFAPASPGWSSIWTREAGQGTASMADGVLSIRHKGRQDWAVQQDRSVPTWPGEIFRISVRAKSHGEGDGGISVVVRAASGDVSVW